MISTISCKKDKLEGFEENRTFKNYSASFKNDGKKNWSDCLNGVDIICGNVLSFNDFNHFLSVYTCLESAYEHWNDSIENEYSSLNDDDYNQLWEDNGWDEDYQFVQFENHLNHNSLRAMLATIEDAWMDDPDNMPDTDDYDFFDDDVMNTLWSADYNIKIGNNLYHIFPNGRVLEVDNADCQLFFSSIADSSVNHPNARLGGPIIPNPSIDIDPTCWKWGWERNYRVPNNAHNHHDTTINGKLYASRFKARASSYYVPGPIWFHKMHTKLKLYVPKRNGYGGFKKFRTDIDGFGISGRYYDGSNSCTPIPNNPVGSTKPRKRRSKYYTALTNYYPLVWIAIKKDEVNAAFTLPGIGYSQLLTLRK
ncbi:MAG: hypothetical protein ACK417_11620 [Bacteroidia bacterium]